MKNKNLQILIECAIMVGLATALGMFKLFEMPFGGSVTFASMLPIAVISYRHGIKIGLLGGFAASLLQLVLGLKNLSYGKTLFAVAAIVLADYIIAFTVIGLAGMFRNLNKDNNRSLSILTFGSGIAIVSILRFICHWVSGAVVWYELTKEWYAGDNTKIVFQFGPWMYSFVYNIMYMAPELLITTAVGILLAYFINLKGNNLAYIKK